MSLEKENFPANSRRAKDSGIDSDRKEKESQEEVVGRRVKVDPIVNTRAIKEPSPAQKFFRRFLTIDMEDIKEQTVTDIIEPAIRNTISELIYCVTGMVLYKGDGRRRPYRGSSGYSGGGYDYSRHSRPSRPRDRFDAREREYERDRDREVSSERRHPRTDWSDLAYIEFDTIADAHDVLDRLDELIERYEEVSVAQLCEMTRQPVVSTDYNWGWKHFDKGTVPKRRGRRYYIDFPEPVYLGE